MDVKFPSESKKGPKGNRTRDLNEPSITIRHALASTADADGPDPDPTRPFHSMTHRPYHSMDLKFL